MKERDRQKEKGGARPAGLILLKPMLFLFCQRTLRLSKPLSLDLAPAPRHGNEPPHTHIHTQDDRDGSMKRWKKRGEVWWI